MSIEKKIQDFSPSIRALLINIDKGIRYKKWIRGQLRKKGFVYKAYTKYQDRRKRKRFILELVEEQKLIDQYRAAIKILKRQSTLQTP